MAKANSGVLALLTAVAGAVGVVALAVAGVFAGAAALEKLARPSHPCPNCRRPVRQDETPCPSCGIELKWERR